jgi:hypothetical protein
MNERDDDSFEERLRAIADEISQAVERAAEKLDLNEVAERIGMSGERVRELTDLAGQWLTEQFQGAEGGSSGAGDDAGPRHEAGVARLAGPDPLDMPTAEQGRALSALDSGRWKVDPGTDELIQVGEGPAPSQPIGLVGELRARDWLAASGEVTLVGRDALRRWLAGAGPD